MVTELYEKRQKTYLQGRIKEHLELFVGKTRLRFQVTLGVEGICCSCGKKRYHMIQTYFTGTIKRRDKICQECIASLMLKLNGNIFIEAKRKQQIIQDAKDAEINRVVEEGRAYEENLCFDQRKTELAGAIS